MNIPVLTKNQLSEGMKYWINKALFGKLSRGKQNKTLNVMSQNQSGHRPVDSLVNKHVMLGVVIIVLCSVWVYARFGRVAILTPLLHSISHINTLETPVAFIATPGYNFLRIYVRSGPGLEYRIIETVPRGTLLTGIGRKPDSHGEFWIMLANGRGYVKESVLSPAKRSAK